MFQMKKFWPILAAILFCVQAFVACSNSELYYAADVFI